MCCALTVCPLVICCIHLCLICLKSIEISLIDVQCTQTQTLIALLHTRCVGGCVCMCVTIETWDHKVLDDGHIRNCILINEQKFMRGAGLSFVAGQKKKPGPTNLNCWACVFVRLVLDGHLLEDVVAELCVCECVSVCVCVCVCV
jgi:hypothetical protein